MQAHTDGEEEDEDEQAEHQAEVQEDEVTRAFHQALAAPKEGRGANLGPGGCRFKYMQQLTWHGLLRRFCDTQKYRLLCCSKSFARSSSAREHIRKVHKCEDIYSAPNSKIVKL